MQKCDQRTLNSNAVRIGTSTDTLRERKKQKASVGTQHRHLFLFEHLKTVQAQPELQEKHLLVSSRAQVLIYIYINKYKVLIISYYLPLKSKESAVNF